jgi:hypothetical protein
VTTPVTIPSMPEAADDPTTPLEAPDLGLLFVHGIGAQEKGATLVAWLDALSHWMDDWLGGAARVAAQCGVSHQAFNTVELTPEARQLLQESRLPAEPRDRTKQGLADPRLQYVTGTAEITSASLSSGEVPANGEMRLRAVSTRGVVVTSTIKVVEAHWQNAFPQPTWGETAEWLLRIAPLLVLLHFGQRTRERFTVVRGVRSFRAIPSFLSSLFQLLVAIAILPVVQLVFLLFSAFGWIPIPGYGSVIAWVQGIVAGALGDAYMFATSPTRLAAVVTETRNALGALTHCKKVVVVAHSQGAAVAYSALKDGCPPNLAGLLTLGSGLKKLEYLRALRREHDVSDTFLVNLPLAMLSASIAYLVAAWLELLPNLIRGWGGWAMLLMSLSFAVLVVASLPSMSTRAVEAWWATQRACNPSRRWLDVFASHDPVSAGRLFATPVDGMESISITNRASWIADHTTYWENVDEFATTVGTWISQVAELAVPLHALNTMDAELMKRAASRRAWRVRALTVFTWLLLASAVLAAKGGLGTPYGLAVNEYLGDAIGNALGRSEGLLGLVVVVGVLWLLLGATRGFWRLWDGREAKDFCSREPDNELSIFLFGAAALPSLLAISFVLWAVVHW